MSRYTHWSPCGCGKQVICVCGRLTEKRYECMICKKRFSKQEIDKYKKGE